MYEPKPHHVGLPMVAILAVAAAITLHGKLHSEPQNTQTLHSYEVAARAQAMQAGARFAPR